MAMWRVALMERHAYCRRFAVADYVSIVKYEDRASLHGLQSCGSMVCPLCGPGIALERAADIALAVTAHCMAGGRVAFVTYTLPHRAGQLLADLLGCLGKAYKAAGSGGHMKPRRLLRLYSAGQIRRLEVTVGWHGWHPHLHELMFLEAGVSDDQAHDLADARYSALTSSLELQGCGKSSLKGYDFELLDMSGAHERLAVYVAGDAAHELSSAGTKWGRGENRTPNQLLSAIARHEATEARDTQLWREYEAAMRGKRVLVWSPGLRDRLLGSEIPEISDADAAASTGGFHRLIAAMGLDTWERFKASRISPATLEQWAGVYTDDDDTRDLLARQFARHHLGELEAGSSHPPQGLTPSP
jgi:hypothetical protein